MNESSILCIAVEEGADCPAEATMLTPAPLCARHQLQIALLVIPDVLTTAVRHAGIETKPVSLAPEERAAIIAGAQPKPIKPYLGGVHGPVVYFIENGATVKIGYSTNLRNRVRSLSLQEKNVALLLQGGLTLERALHATYDKERIDSTEWFTKSERLVAFIESKRSALGVQPQTKTQRQVRRRVVLTASAGPAVPRADRVEILRALINDVGGDPADLPLKTIQDRFGVHKSTASRMRSEAASNEA